jgi:NAD(P)H-flavin reductase
MLQAAEAASSQPPWWDLTVLTVEHRCVDVAVLQVRPHAPLPYVAGQSIAVEIPTRPRLWRYYSPATLPAEDGSFELHVRLVPGGPVSTAMVQTVRPGDVFRSGAPVGDRLTLPPGESGELLLLAGGTGLAPMKALVQHLESGPERRRVHLFWGARFHRELYDLPAMRQLTDRLADVSFVPCVSHEQTDGVTAAAGSVVDVALGHGPWQDHDVYVCGSPAMVDATVAALLRAGTPSDRVRREEFGSEEIGT